MKWLTRLLLKIKSFFKKEPEPEPVEARKHPRATQARKRRVAITMLQYQLNEALAQKKLTQEAFTTMMRQKKYYNLTWKELGYKRQIRERLKRYIK